MPTQQVAIVATDSSPGAEAADAGPLPLSARVPDIGALELFLSVARLGSLGQAAALHRISQPAAGSRIRHLEGQLGLPLIERSARGSRLTSDGELVVPWAREVVTAAASLEAGVAALRGLHEGRLCLAASLTIAEYLVPAWLVALRARCPESTVSLRVVNSAEVVRLVAAGSVDLGFIECPGLTPGLCSRVIGHDELFVVVPPGHPWMRRCRPLAAVELAQTALVCREPGSGTRCTLEAVLAPVGGLSAPLVELSSTTAIKSAVIEGVGAAVLSSLAVAGELAAGRLVRVAVEPAIRLRRDLRVVWPAGQVGSRAVRQVLAAVTGGSRDGRR